MMNRDVPARRDPSPVESERTLTDVEKAYHLGNGAAMRGGAPVDAQGAAVPEQCKRVSASG